MLDTTSIIFYLGPNFCMLRKTTTAKSWAMFLQKCNSNYYFWILTAVIVIQGGRNKRW